MHRPPRPTPVVVGLAVLAALVRLPYLGLPVGADEGGFRYVAAQWHPGTSLYGDHWVDRPPGLLAFFALGDALGGQLGVRLLAVVVVAATVLLAGWVGALAGGSGPLAALTACVFLSTPMLGAREVNGELLAMPFVLLAAALALLVVRGGPGGAPHHPPHPHRLAVLAGAGAAAAGAVLVKQNFVDGVLVLLVLLVLGRLGPRLPAVLAVAAGGLGLTALALAGAAARGTDPLALWDAVVVFRLDAARVIADLAPVAPASRRGPVLWALVGSTAPVLAVLLVLRLRRRPAPGVPDLRLVAVVVLAWEAFSIAAGGSWWLHYLLVLVPGLVLCTTVLTQPVLTQPVLTQPVLTQPVLTQPGLTPPAPPRAPRRSGRPDRAVAAALALAAASAVLSTGLDELRPGLRTEDPVVSWLRTHVEPGQSLTVAFGRPDYPAVTGADNPYEHLWSLPVRVRDPDLVAFTAVLQGPDRPDWVLTPGTGRLGGWALRPELAQAALEAAYDEVAQVGDVAIWALADPPADPPAGS